MDKQDNLSPQELERLKVANLVWTMAESAGYQQVLKPLLLSKLNQSFPDPTTVTGTAREAQWTYECKVAAIFKKVVAELLAVVDGYVAEAQQLEAKNRGEIPVIGVGRE